MKFENLNTKKFEYFCSRAAAVIGILILGFLSLYSLFYTREFRSNHDDIPLEAADSPLLILLLMAAALLVMLYVGHLILKNEKYRKRNVNILLAVTCIYAVVYGIWWAFACNYYMMWDPRLVSFWADQLANGIDDVSSGDIDYITTWPHQMGMIALLEFIYKIFGQEEYHAFQVVNALGAGAIIFIGYHIIRQITERIEPAVYYLLLMLCCHPLFIYVTFVYGDVLSVTFSMLAVYFLLRWIKHGKKRYIFFLAVSLTAACLIRSNCYIVVAAVGCVLFVKMISDKKIWHGIAFAGCILFFLISHSVLIHAYEERLGFSLHDGMPSVLWLSMGLQEGGSDGETEAGWYSGLAWDIFVDEVGKDQELAKQRAYEEIGNSVESFKENPAYALDFFKRKISSEWNDPTYSCLQETNRRVDARAPIMDRLYKGDLWKPFVQVMDVYQSLIYFGALIFLLLLIRKKIPVEHLTLLIVVIGGFIFYIFWEAKSRYTFPYFMMMIPAAAMGWDMLLQKAVIPGHKLRQKLEQKRAASGRQRKQVPWEKLEPLAGKLILIGAGVPSALLFLYSLIFTTVYESNDLEVPAQVLDPVPLIFLFLAAGLLILCFAGRVILKNESCRKRNLNLLLGAVLLHCVVFCTAWNLLARSELKADPLFVHAVAGGFALGDVSPSAMDYLYTYPHQAGQALLLELVYRIFGYENLLAFRMLNTLGVLVFVYSGYQITGLLYEKDTVKVNFLLLSAGCIPLLIYTNVIYGEVLAAAAVAFAVWMFLLWLRQEKGWQFLLLVLAMIFAVYMKNNCLIAAVAMGGVMICKAIAERRKKPALFVIPLAAVLLLAQPVMTSLYEYRSGWPLDQGMPKNLWVAMGLQGEGMSSGWWNEFPDQVYKEQAGYDPETAKELGDAAIALSLQGFRENPKAAAVFFARKFVSQWNDASYGCEVSAGSQDTPVLDFWMNGYQSIVFLGAAGFALLRFRRQKKVEECLPLLILLGGFLFHMVWEVKGRYGMFYFVLLLPAAAAGLEEINTRLQGLWDRRKKTE